MFYANGQKGGDQYIRNQNVLSDWKDITLPNSQASAITMKYDGVIVASVESNQGRTHKLNISQDGGTTWKSIVIDQNYSDEAGGSATLNFNKGDMIYYSVNTTSLPIVSYVAFYELRDYTGR